MRTDEINNCINEIIKSCKSPFCNIYIRFYIKNKLMDTIKIIKSYYYSYKGVYFDNILTFLKCNNHWDYINTCDYSFLEGKIKCEGHGEFYGTDKLIINFKRFEEINNEKK